MKRLIILGLLLCLSLPAWASDQPQVEILPVEPQLGQPLVRIKDIARVQGVRDNQLVGLGLVVGLNGTGDGRGAVANIQMVVNMLENFGITVDADQLRVRNIAAVMVTATLPTDVRAGDNLDVTVSSLGDARSLQGGFLLQTPLEAANGRVYAVAQGPISIGGFEVSGGGASASRNHATVGRIPAGAIVEREVPSTVTDGQELTLVLHQPDFTTAARIADAIQGRLGRGTARALDRSAVLVQIPEPYQNDIVSLISTLEELQVQPDAAAKVVINERTGTVVMGHHVRIAAVAVAHGGLRVRITPELEVHQPPPFSSGETVVGAMPQLEVEEEEGALALIPTTTSVDDLVQALNTMGVTPRDIISILQAIDAAGALYGELEII
ncbi:MAG: flagellar basal body P-ring protein FlgI [Limnochordia bacterium]|jgi:flagellar P-ring protein precursor FlgI